MHKHLILSITLLSSFSATSYAGESRIVIRINGSSLSNSKTADAFKVSLASSSESVREIPMRKEIHIDAAKKKAVYTYTIDQADIDGDSQNDSLNFSITAEAMGGKLDLGNAKIASLGVAGGKSNRIDKGEGLKISLGEIKLNLSKQKQATIESKGFHTAKIVGKSDSGCTISRDNDATPAKLERENLAYSFPPANEFELKYTSGAFRLKRLSYTFMIKY